MKAARRRTQNGWVITGSTDTGFADALLRADDVLTEEGWQPANGDKPRDGSLRAYNEATGTLSVVEPQDPMFSTMNMCATEFYSRDGGWQVISIDEE